MLLIFSNLIQKRGGRGRERRREGRSGEGKRREGREGRGGEGLGKNKGLGLRKEEGREGRRTASNHASDPPFFTLPECRPGFPLLELAMM